MLRYIVSKLTQTREKKAMGMNIDKYEATFPPGTQQGNIDAGRELWVGAIQRAYSTAEHVTAKYRRTRYLGRFVLIKQVGPPPWRFPKTKFEPRRSKLGNVVIHAGIGWRSTAYEVIWVWAR